MNKLNIWLAYVSYPVTTAVYFERALRKYHSVITMGPKLPQETIKNWQLENMKLEVKDLDQPLPFIPDMKELISLFSPKFHPDLYLWIESVYGYFPQNLDSLKIPKACYLIDSHLNLEWHVKWALNFDYVFIAQIEYLQTFKDAGCKNVFWLPLGCDIEIHDKFVSEKKYDVGFVGSIFPESRREKLINSIKNKFNFHYERCFWTEMSEVFSQSKIVFNNAVRNDLNMRLFEVMSTGSFILTDLALKSAQDILFKDGADYGIYEDINIIDKLAYYLNNEKEREEIARNGQQLVRTAHQYLHRIEDMLNVIFNNKKNTFSPYELREKSVLESRITTNTEDTYKKIEVKSANKSYIIPVLDYAPASQYSILTLLEDLEGVDGEVIVVFNNEQVASEIKDNKRINHYAILSSNVGVARAWNVGLNIARTPYAYIINSDVKVSIETINAIENGLVLLGNAASVGPQGSFFNYKTLKDYIYFDKGTFSKPIEVDAVSGFLFGVNTKYFNEGLLKFENEFTPCYFEEWDLGLQIRRAGLKSYVVPSKNYEHEWSGSIKSYRKIKFYDVEETVQEIHSRNKKYFLEKWDRITSKEDCKWILKSGWFDFALNEFEGLLEQNNILLAEKLLINLDENFPNNDIIMTSFGILNYMKNNIESAVEYLRKAVKINPKNEIALENLKIIQK